MSAPLLPSLQSVLIAAVRSAALYAHACHLAALGVMPASARAISLRLWQGFAGVDAILLRLW